MTRSIWKGPFVDGYMLAKAEKAKAAGRHEVIKTWSRRSTIMPDFIGLTDKRDTVSLYGLQAKVKLVDFWASWCGPCRAEMPNVKKVYKKYHGKGLEILGVSIDQKAEDWLKALETDRLPWVNILDQESRIAAYFLVQAIPHTILLDENNKIIAKNLRGKELEAKIAEVLGE